MYNGGLFGSIAGYSVFPLLRVGDDPFAMYLPGRQHFMGIICAEL